MTTATTALECPACSHRRHRQYQKYVTLHECLRCGAVWGTCHQGEYFQITGAAFCTLEPQEEREVRYYDLLVLSAGRGVYRTHGWFSPAERCITQVG